jgi:hypothetical protein
LRNHKNDSSPINNSPLPLHLFHHSTASWHH